MSHLLSEFPKKVNEERFIHVGDVLVNSTGTGTLGRVAQIRQEPKEPTTVDSHVTIVRPKSNIFFQDFFGYMLIFIEDSIKAAGEGCGGQTELAKSVLANNFTVAYPTSLVEQQRIVTILDEAFEAIAAARANAEHNRQNARALFESYLQSVFSQRGDGWVERKLGDQTLLRMIDGDRGTNYPKATDFLDHGPCLFLNTKNVRPNGFEFDSTMFISAEKDAQLRKGKLQRNDVVMTTRGTIGNIGLYSEEVPFDSVRINSGMLIFRANQTEILPAYLFEILRSGIVKEQINKYTTGAAQPQLPIKTLVNFSIPVPTTLAGQSELVKRIRDFEPETQRLESLYQSKIAALDELKQSLLQHAFSGQLDTTRQEMLTV
ncbi:restriction endonuclease subunit S [Aeromonas rivipollensis]|uniref:restriction endonuclease subunit S n=2 Tax=Aeromonas TaxID=642 RepID=UPI003D262874